MGFAPSNTPACGVARFVAVAAAAVDVVADTVETTVDRSVCVTVSVVVAMSVGYEGERLKVTGREVEAYWPSRSSADFTDRRW